MSALPVARVLTDLESETGQARQSRISPELTCESQKRADGEKIAEEAWSRGFAEGKAAERAECSTRLAQQLAAFEEKLSQERKNWVSAESGRLGATFTSAIADFEARVADKITRILTPVLTAEVRRRAVGELLGALDGLLSKGVLARLSVSGPEDLLEDLRLRLAGKVENVTFLAAAGCDLRVTADETTLETRIADWARAIAGDEQ